MSSNKRSSKQKNDTKKLKVNSKNGNSKKDTERKSPSPSPSPTKMTMAERRKKALEAKKERERKEQEEKERMEAEKREAAKNRKKNMKAADQKNRQQYEEIDGKYFCTECGELIAKEEFDDHIVEHPAQVRRRIWLGAAENARDVAFMKKAGITHILNCTHEIEFAKDVIEVIKEFKRISLWDRTTSDLMANMKEAITWSDHALSDKEAVLFVHCREGKSRSVSFLCAYLMWKENIGFESALASVQSKRWIAQPNPKFFKQLVAMDEVLQAEKNKPPAERTYPPSKYKFKIKPVQKKKNNQNKN